MNPPRGITAYLWRRTSWRHGREEWASTLLLLALLAVGVASFLSIRIANRAAVASFDLFHQTVQPRSDWILRAPAGGLPLDRLTALQRLAGPLPLSLIPVAETAASPRIPSAADDRAVRVVGLDLVALSSALGGLGGDWLDLGEDATFAPRRAWLAGPLADRWSVSEDDLITLLFGTTPVELAVAGRLPERTGAGETPANLVLMDLPALLDLLGPASKLDRVEVVLPEGSVWQHPLAELEETLRADPLWALSLPAEEARGGEQMTAAFRLNLTVLSLIALLVATYLIAQALDAFVVHRRQEIAILRSLGLTEKMIHRGWRFEFAVLGVSGGLGGLFLGWALAQFTAGAVAQTVNTLYFVTEPPAGVALQLGDLWWALGLGLGGSLIAGWLPLRDAARTPPAQVLAAGNFSPGFGLLRRPGIGLLLLAVGAACWLFPPLELAGGGRFPLAGYGAAFCWLIGGTLVVSALFAPLAAAMRGIDRGSAAIRLARARLADASSRHRLAAAGLLVAVTMAAAMSVLVGSFSRTMDRWIEVRFQADLFVSSAGSSSASAEFNLEPAVIAALAAHPAVETLDPFRVVPIRLHDRRTFLAGSRHELVGDRQQVLWLEGPETVAATATPAWVNEAFIERFSTRLGDTLELPTPHGPETVTISAVFADYGNEQGLVWVDWPVFTQWFDSTAATNASLFLLPGADLLAVGEELRQIHPGLAVRDNPGLRAAVRRIFRQTFAVTEALKVIGLAVALGGLGLALGNLLRESRTELRTLRLMGFRRREIATATALESVGITLIGLVGGLALSVALGALLVFVINKQSFGWTLQWALPWAQLGLIAGTTLLLAAGVGYLVGHRHATWRQPR